MVYDKERRYQQFEEFRNTDYHVTRTTRFENGKQYTLLKEKTCNLPRAMCHQTLRDSYPNGWHGLQPSGYLTYISAMEGCHYDAGHGDYMLPEEWYIDLIVSTPDPERIEKINIYEKEFLDHLEEEEKKRATRQCPTAEELLEAFRSTR